MNMTHTTTDAAEARAASIKAARKKLDQEAPALSRSAWDFVRNGSCKHG